MRAVLFFLIIFFSLSKSVLAQSSTQIRRLPPSLERELKLKHGGKIRIVGFVDTLKAQNIIARSIRDSSTEELDSLTAKDSAIIVIDSSVSLTDKEWLDSMIAQLPEYKMTPEGIRFYYPADILIETNRKVVPPDTTLASRMDPVTKEDLPLYDALPMPRPLRQLSLPRTSIELGAGAPYLPLIDVSSLIVSNDRSVVELDGKFKTTSASEPAIKQYWKIGANGSFAFPDTSISSGERVPQLDIGASAGSNRRQLLSDADNGTYSLSRTNLDANFTIGSPEQLKLRARTSLSLLTDNAIKSFSENQGVISLLLTKQITSPFVLSLGTRYESATTLGLTDLPSIAPSLFETKLFLEQKEGLIQWKAGVSYFTGNDAGGKSSLFSPIIAIHSHLSQPLEIGGIFESDNQLVTLSKLTARNLFFWPQNLISLPLVGDYTFRIDGRRIISEPIHFTIFANYFLSLDDEVHGEFRFIRRNNEPIFEVYQDLRQNGLGPDIFFVTPMGTRRIEFEAGGSFIIFERDKIRGSLLLRSASDLKNNNPLPYEPTTQIQASYKFGNWEKFTPQVELINLERLGHSLTFINLAAKYIFSPAFQLKFRAENIFGSAGDFWTGYDEYPRSVWVSGEYRF